jgi:hypothetical protein
VSTIPTSRSRQLACVARFRRVRDRPSRGARSENPRGSVMSRPPAEASSSIQAATRWRRKLECGTAIPPTMALPRAFLGDSHNFGRRVEVRDGRIFKPRALLWEWLLLSADSPLRRLLESAALLDGLGREAFDFLPSLKFHRSRSGTGGGVERIALRPLGKLSATRKRELAAISGRSLALWSWLGLSDLHWENLVLGVDEQGSIVFTPIDIEMILSDLSRPTQTKLLPDADPEYAAVNRHACGIRRVLPFLGKPMAGAEVLVMAGAYRSTLIFLDRHARTISDVLARVPGMRETPIRVCLRSTAEYVHAGSEPPWPPLLDAEMEQLDRGDIPYFFRFYGRRGIHYYAGPSLTKIARLPLSGDVPQLEPLLSLSRGLKAPFRKKLREEGLFTVLGAFDHVSLTGSYQSDALAVTFGARTLVVTLPGGEELRTRRNLQAFVGSVYLPCRCGEVRSVFVPSVTRCHGGPDERL